MSTILSIFKPHEYQGNYLASIAAGWIAGFLKQLVVSPTGSGKTVMFSFVTAEFVKAGHRVLILVDQDELVWQTIKKLKDVAGIKGEVEKAEWRANKDAQVVVATVQSMAKRLAGWPADAFGLVIADEADKSITAQWQTVLNHFDKTAKVCGFTATPHRTDAKNLGVYYDNLIEHENLHSLIKKGFLAPIRVEMFPVTINLDGLGKGRDFKDEELDELITPHLEELARAVQRFGSFRRSLVFLPLVKTCEKFNEVCLDMGLNSDYIHGKDEDREAKLKRFANWDFDVLANSLLLTRGVDIPGVDLIGMFRPTKSITLYFQTVGRGTRIAEGKTDCILLDPLYQASKKLICRPAHLIGKTDEEVESITALAEERFAGMPADVASQMDLLALAGDASAQREAALRKKLEEHKSKKAQTISAEEFALQHNAFKTAEFQPVMAWEARPLSPSQLKHLGKAKIDPATVRGTEHANQLINLYYKTKPITMASFAQRQTMKRLGYQGWEHATEQQAKTFFATLRKPKEAQLSW